MRSVVGLALRFLVAVGIGMLTWFCCTHAYGSYRNIQSAVCHVTDWPVAAVARLVFPNGDQAIDVFYGRSLCDFCSGPEVIWRHLRLSTPLYVLLLYVPNILVWAMRRFQRDVDAEARL
jgi:hypothetical protein